jgi:hypothetical protein
VPIDLSKLPRETRDKLSLKEMSDPTFYRATDEDFSQEFFNTLYERGQPGVEHSVLISTYGEQGSGKSHASIALCCYIDPTFTVDRIFFSYNELVKHRASLKPNTAVLLDEQTQSYGVDSVRVMIMINSIKEQLRKKSIHMFFCSPVLHSESATSMYILETMFIDRENKECFAALKTREGLTLGHVRIPSPLKILEDGTSLATKELMDAYERKKDEHLERLLGQKSYDELEERATMVAEHELFKQAEALYVKKLGYMPRDRVVQVVNVIYPEYNSGVMPHEIAERIRLRKELSGKWIIPLGGKNTSAKKKG